MHEMHAPVTSAVHYLLHNILALSLCVLLQATHDFEPQASLAALPQVTFPFKIWATWKMVLFQKRLGRQVEMSA